MRAVLVTGGAGYVGSHICKAVAARGMLPVALDNLTTGHDWAVKWGPLVVADIRDMAALNLAFANHQPEAVIHCAALSLVGASAGDPGPYFATNVTGTLCLLEAMRRHKIGRMVFSSSCAVYGQPDRVPVSETEPLKPVSPYGSTKAAAEAMLRDFCAAYGMAAAALRYFNAAGSDSVAGIGEAHAPETHLIPLAIQAAQGKRPGLEVFGNDYPTPDGTCIRDYIHVSDLAAAHVAALDRLSAVGGFHALNLGIGRGYSVAEVIAAVRRVSGRSFPIHWGARRAGDPPLLVAEAGRARAELGWQPRIPTLDGIVASAWAWHSRGAA